MFQLGIAHQSIVDSDRALKQAALLVDSLVYWPRDFAIAHNPQAHGSPIVTLRTSKRRPPKARREAVDQITWLAERGFLKMVDIRVGDVSIAVRLKAAPHQQLVQVPHEAVNAILQKVPAGDLKAVRDLMPRVVAAALREASSYDTIALHRQALPTPLANNRAEVVAHIGMACLPAPNDDTPWDDIFEFRSSPRALALRDRFTRWLRKVSEAAARPADLQEEICEAIFEYEQYLQECDLKSGHSGFESLIRVPAEVLEALVKFRWSDAAKAMFFLKRRRADLLQAERTAPHPEVAYVVEARRHFGRTA